jgi:hypothetical protein
MDTDGSRIFTEELNWPMVHMALQRKPTTELELLDFLNYFRSILDIANGEVPGITAEKVSILLEVNCMPVCSVQDFALLVDFMKDIEVKAQAVVRAIAVVTPTKDARDCVTAIMQMKPPKSVHGVFSDVSEARAWLSDTISI